MHQQSLQGKTIEQIAKFVGDGQLTDNSNTQIELRKILSDINSDILAEHAKYCLDHAFKDSGFILQDIVNEFGRRLDFEVRNGRYRGNSNAIGSDGLWLNSREEGFVVEVKTTDAYTIELEKIDKYRTQLKNQDHITHELSMILIVGRKDTGALEAQVRGSKFAWTMRIIGIDALIKMVKIKESSCEKEVTEQIWNIFKPIEYTRVDKIVDLVFTATEDQKSNDLEPESSNEEAPILGGRRELNFRRDQIAIAFGTIKKVNLLKRNMALFSSSNGEVKIAIAVSKRYKKNTWSQYWYAYLPAHRTFLAGANTTYMIFGCLDLNTAFAIPSKIMSELIPNLNLTEKDGRIHYHIHIKDEAGNFSMNLKNQKNLDLTSYKFDL